ncbi:MAG: GWxTD domain-containing protein [Chloroherpetonaceae bacterium]
MNGSLFFKLAPRALAKPLWVMCLCALCLSVVQGLLAQQGSGFDNRFATARAPEFNADIIAFKDDSTGATRLTLYTRIPYNKLSFVKRDSAFCCFYEINAAFVDKNGRMTHEEHFIDTIRTTDYQRTIAKDIFHSKSFTFTLSPNTYTAHIKIIDLESRREYKETRTVTVKNFMRQGIHLSTVMLVFTRFDSLTGKLEYYPNLSAAIIQDKTEPQLYYEVYVTDRAMDSLHLNYNIVSKSYKDEVVDEYTRTFVSTGKKTRILDTLSMQKLKSGNYLLTISAFDKFTKQVYDKATLFFFTRISGQAMFIRNLDEAIEQLEYIADGDEIDKMRNAKSQEEKLRLFNAFWARVDPTPETPENELMVEYYSRIEFANQNFSSYFPGWKTDMGRVYIKYGPPDFIERQPFSMDSQPYEIWEYYQHNIRLIFVDTSGFGNYRLVRPEWDARNRIR